MSKGSTDVGPFKFGNVNNDVDNYVDNDVYNRSIFFKTFQDDSQNQYKKKPSNH